jgi:hypothetical protein
MRKGTRQLPTQSVGWSDTDLEDRSHQRSWTQAFADALRSGSVASVVTTLVLAACGACERADAPAPLNGPSQWIWGRHAAYRRGFSSRYTLAGYAIHHAMSVFWATVFEKLRRRAGTRKAVVFADAAATAALACAVDFRVVPDRLSPGFQKQLSRTSLLLVYAAFCLSLAATALSVRK